MSLPFDILSEGMREVGLVVAVLLGFAFGFVISFYFADEIFSFLLLPYEWAVGDTWPDLVGTWVHLPFAVVIIAAAIVLRATAYTVNPTEQAIITQFGEPVRESGRHRRA